MKIAGASTGLPMATAQGTSRSAGRRDRYAFCALFGTSAIEKDVPGLFIAKRTEPWNLADCSDASMP